MLDLSEGGARFKRLPRQEERQGGQGHRGRPHTILRAGDLHGGRRGLPEGQEDGSTSTSTSHVGGLADHREGQEWQSLRGLRDGRCPCGGRSGFDTLGTTWTTLFISGLLIFTSGLLIICPCGGRSGFDTLGTTWTTLFTSGLFITNATLAYRGT